MSQLPRHSESHDRAARSGAKPARPWLPFVVGLGVVAVFVLVIALHVTGVIDAGGGH